MWTIRGFRPLHVAAVLVVMAGASYMVEPIRDRVQWVILAPQYLAGTHLNAWELQDELTGTVGSLVVALRVMAIDLRDSRSEEHTSELQSLMRISYAVFCLKKKKQKNK